MYWYHVGNGRAGAAATSTTVFSRPNYVRTGTHCVHSLPCPYIICMYWYHVGKGRAGAAATSMAVFSRPNYVHTGTLHT